MVLATFGMDYCTEGLVKEELIGPEVHVQSFISDDREGGTFTLSVFGETEDVVGIDLEIDFDEDGYPDINCEWQKGLGNDYTTMTTLGGNGISVSKALLKITEFIHTYGKGSGTKQTKGDGNMRDKNKN